MQNFKNFLIENNHKQAQLELILKNNPMTDNKHTGIRKIADIKTAEEAFAENDFEATPDFTKEDMENALRTNSITIYSSKPFSIGSFVTPSKIEAQNYAGNAKIYSKTVPLNYIAWIDAIEGQFAPIL